MENFNVDMENIITFRRPASVYGDPWRSALPCGNGKTGALMHGWVSRENIVVNDHALWLGGTNGGTSGGKLPDISGALAATRAAIDSGDYKKANGMISQALVESGFAASLNNPAPLGSLRIIFPVNKSFSHYRRGIDMESGEAFTRFKIGGDEFERKMFVSRAEGIVAINISGSVAAENILWLEPQNNGDAASAKHIAALRPATGRTAAIETESGEKRAFCSYSAKDGGLSFGMAMYVLGADKIEKRQNSEANAEAVYAYGANMTLLIKTFVISGINDAEETEKAVETAIGELRAISRKCAPCGKLYEELLKSHAKLHAPLFNDVKLRLCDDKYGRDTVNEILADEAYETLMPNLLLERLWKFGRYLFVCGTAEDANPFPLYGLWHGTYDLPWSQHVANENVQMIYWHVFAGGLGRMCKSLIKYYTSEIESYREIAKKMFGCRGIFVPVYTSPKNSRPSVPVPVITNYIGTSGWLGCMFHDYYLYTGDEKLLESDILPFMRETALFYEDYLKYDENGECLIYPSVSPENTPANLLPEDYAEFMAHPCPSVKNSTMDFAIMKDLLSRLISCVSARGENVGEWRGIISKIPEYMVNADGAVKEWMAPELEDNYNHRHLSHIYPVFPGNEINCRDDARLFGAFKKAVELRLLKGQSGWSLAHMACIWARLGEAQKAMECFDTLAKGCLGDNLFTMHNDYRHMGASLDLGTFAPVQLDANMGAVNAVFEMLLRRLGDTLFILPAVDFDRIEKGSVENIHFVGGEADIAWDRESLSFTLRARSDLNLAAELPKKYGGENIPIAMKKSGIYSYSSFETEMKGNCRLSTAP